MVTVEHRPMSRDQDVEVTMNAGARRNIEFVSRGDPINHPAHYTQGRIEPIAVIEDWALPFHLANVVKYIARARHHGTELDDLRKAAWYLDRWIGLKQQEEHDAAHR